MTANEKENTRVDGTVCGIKTALTFGTPLRLQRPCVLWKDYIYMYTCQRSNLSFNDVGKLL